MIMEFLDRRGFNSPVEKAIGTWMLTIVAGGLGLMIWMLSEIFWRHPLVLVALALFLSPAIGVYVCARVRKNRRDKG